MSRNDAADFTMRLYARMPAYYRYCDAEKGYPLLALLRVIGEQAANLRQDLDALWDNYFIETCDDWVVPYIGALIDVDLPRQPIAQSDRLQVAYTIRWRRGKGTPPVLGEVANAMSGWAVDLAELYRSLGWTQNLNHARPDAVLTPDLHAPHRLDLLGQATDPFAYAADVRASHPRDQARITPDALGIGRAAWGAPGRHAMTNVGFFARRLQTFRLEGVTPASAASGKPHPADATRFTFDPLYRATPLFIAATGAPLTRAAFDHAPESYFGKDVGVRQFGVLIASDAAPPDDPTASARAAAGLPRSLRSEGGAFEAIVPNGQPFTFGGTFPNSGVYTHITMRLLDPASFQLGGAHFIITAGWRPAEGGDALPLAALSTLHAALGDSNIAHTHPAALSYGGGQLALTVETGHPSRATEARRAGRRAEARRVEWPEAWSDLPPSPPARFPGAVLAVHAVRSGTWHAADALYIYLPPCYIAPGAPAIFDVYDDGSTARGGDRTRGRASEGQVYPAHARPPGAAPVTRITRLNRRPGGLRLLDHERFDERVEGMRVEVGLCDLSTGTFVQAFSTPLGAVATARQTHMALHGLDIPNPWPPFTYAPATVDVSDGEDGLHVLGLHLVPLAGSFLPQAELIVASRDGTSLLVYVPEIAGVGPDGAWLLVAADGSTYLAPDPNQQTSILRSMSYAGLVLARASAGQALPMRGPWPLQQRRPVAAGLTDGNVGRDSPRWPHTLRLGQLGIDPEQGRFALPPTDPALRDGQWSVDYVEAFSDRVGARTFDRQIDTNSKPTRLVARSGDAWSALNPSVDADHIHNSLAAAIAAAQDGDVIEIVDSATYDAGKPLEVPAVARSLTVRAGAGQRPCLSFYRADGSPAEGSFQVTSPMDYLELNGLLISGGPLEIRRTAEHMQLIACTLDPRSARRTGYSLAATDTNPDHAASYVVCRCITGALRTDASVRRLTIADSIVDQRGALAIGGAIEAFAPTVQLERATVLGEVRCMVLQASECLFDERVVVDDRQAGCIRFSRFEPGSVLPLRYRCVPTHEHLAACESQRRCMAPVFNSRLFGRPSYGQLGPGTPQAVLTASEVGAEAGAFAGTLGMIRLGNLETKLHEYLPVGLKAAIIAQT